MLTWEDLIAAAGPAGVSHLVGPGGSQMLAPTRPTINDGFDIGSGDSSMHVDYRDNPAAYQSAVDKFEREMAGLREKLASGQITGMVTNWDGKQGKENVGRQYAITNGQLSAPQENRQYESSGWVGLRDQGIKPFAGAVGAAYGLNALAGMGGASMPGINAAIGAGGSGAAAPAVGAAGAGSAGIGSVGAGVAGILGQTAKTGLGLLTDNPRMALGLVGGLLGASGAASPSNSFAADVVGPPVQWSSGLQMGIQPTGRRVQPQAVAGGAGAGRFFRG